MRSILLCLSFIVASFSAHAQLAGTTWSLYNPNGSYFFDFIFAGNDTLYVDLGSGFISPLATYAINGNTLTTVQADPEDDCSTPGVYTFEIVGDTLVFTLVSDACADRIFIFTEFDWILEISTAIGTNEPASISIHPNPSTGPIAIEREGTGNAQVRVYTITGELVHESRLSGSRTQIDLSALPKAIHVLRVTDDKTDHVSRIVLH